MVEKARENLCSDPDCEHERFKHFDLYAECGEWACDCPEFQEDETRRSDS